MALDLYSFFIPFQFPLRSHDTIYGPQPGEKLWLLKETNFTKSKP